MTWAIPSSLIAVERATMCWALRRFFSPVHPISEVTKVGKRHGRDASDDGDHDKHLREAEAHRGQVKRGDIPAFRTFASLSGSGFRWRFS